MKQLERFIARHSSKFREGISASARKRREWTAFVDRARPYFESVITECEKQHLFEVLYVHEPHSSQAGPPYISLFWGKHPTGYFAPGGGHLVEGSCALHFAQGVRGTVVCVLYPFKSAFLERKEQYYVCAVFKRPSRIRSFHLRQAVQFTFSYAQVTSSLGHPDVWDHVRVSYLWLRTKVAEIKWEELLRTVVKQVAGLVTKFAKP